MINLRNALMTGKRLPYDAEVEYLEGDGACGILIPYPLNPNIANQGVISVRYARVNLSSGAIVWGSRRGDGVPANSIGVHHERNSNSLSRQQVGGQDVYSTWISGSKAQTKFYTCTFDFDNNTVTFWDGETKSFYRYSYIYGIGLFGQANSAGTGLYAYSKVRINSFTIERNSVFVYDLIPVRKGTVGYFYDRVSGALFGNAGTGAFTYGNDLRYPIPAE